MKKVVLFLMLLLCCMPLAFDNKCVFAEEGEEEKTVQQQLDESVSEQLTQLNFEDIEDVVLNLRNSGVDVFGGQSFWQKVGSIIDGGFDEGYDTYFNAVFSNVFSDVLHFIPLMATIIAVTILCSLVGSFKGKFADDSIKSIVEFVIFAVVVVIVCSVVIELFNSSKNLIGQISTQVEVIFPILLTLLASIGGTVSVGVFQPAVAILSSVVIKVFTAVIMPLLIFIFVFTIVANFSKTLKFDKMIGFFKSVLKWFAVICFSVFMFVLTIQGIVAGSFDGVSIKAMRFAVKSYVPILGGYLSDGLNIACLSSMLIKNAVGLSGLILLFASVIGPIVNIIVAILIFKLTAGILQPITESKVHGFLSSVADILKLLLMILLAVVFMYLISVGLIMCLSNTF